MPGDPPSFRTSSEFDGIHNSSLPPQVAMTPTPARPHRTPLYHPPLRDLRLPSPLTSDDSLGLTPRPVASSSLTSPFSRSLDARALPPDVPTVTSLIYRILRLSPRPEISDPPITHHPNRSGGPPSKLLIVPVPSLVILLVPSLRLDYPVFHFPPPTLAPYLLDIPPIFFVSIPLFFRAPVSCSISFRALIVSDPHASRLEPFCLAHFMFHPLSHSL